MFNPELTAAEWYLGGLSAENLPEFACEALERGHDGSNLRRLAGLVKPTRGDLEGIVDGALRELGIAAPLSKDDAALWALETVKASAGSTQITAQNLIGKLLTALPELDEPYVVGVKSYNGLPGNYWVVAVIWRRALEGHIEKRNDAEFVRRSSSFIEEVCNSADAEAVNVLWIELFEWLVHSPAGELRFLWPSLGPATRATIQQVAFRRRETENLP